VSLLKAIKEYNPRVKRVVITSSFAANIDVAKGLRPGYTYTETDWNPMTLEDAFKADPVSAYLVSKAEAEKAAFALIEKEKVRILRVLPQNLQLGTNLRSQILPLQRLPRRWFTDLLPTT
jgi:nucleoside-diphosphate-sugar epimerase